MINKVLIIIDTNIINTDNYSNENLGSNYNAIKTFIKKLGLEEHIHIAIPRVVLDEILSHVKNSYKKDLNDFSLLTEKLKKCGKNKIECAIDSSYLPEIKKTDLIRKEIKNNKYVHLLEFPKNIKLPKDLYNDSLYKRGIFKKHSARAFKDALIIELIKGSKIIKSFDIIYILTENKNDFGFYTEFLEKKLNKILKIVTSIEYLETELEELFEYKYLHIKSFTNTEYFKDIVLNYIRENIPRLKKEIDELKIEVKDIQERMGVEDSYLWIRLLITNSDKVNQELFVEMDETNEILNIDEDDRA